MYSPKSVETGVGAKSLWTLSSISDIDHNASYEAEGPFECIYVKT